GTVVTTLVFANQSRFEKNQYKDYLADKLPGQAITYTSVNGDHFTMLKGDSARLIADKITPCSVK
ncbi:MAG: hypothetical protein MJK04_22190, partial [Psychrosphaera sp.]|nr:hypothetical protein [Psychrosphaera sp.]